MNKNDELLSIDQLCQLLNIKRSVAYRLVREKEIKKAIQIGREWRIPMSEVEAYLKEKME